MDPEVAVIVALPRASDCARAELLIEATLLGAALQVTVLVTSCEEPSLNTPVAVNCCVFPKASEAEVGEIVML